MGPKALQFIQAVARKLLAKPAKPGEGIITIGNRMQAEAKAGEIAETFRASGLTPDKWDDFLKSEKDVTKYLNIIESTRKQAIEEATKKSSKDILKVPKKKERPFTGFTPKVVKKVDLSKYDDDALNALAEEGNKIKVQLEKLGESGTNYGEFKKLSARKKEIDDILSAAQDVPPSGYDNFKADLSLAKQRGMSVDDYKELKKEWFGRIIANTDDDINTFLKKGINASDERFVTLSKDQRKDFLDMVEYRLKHGNEKFMNDSEMFFKKNGRKPHEYGGLAGMLGEPTYADGGRIGFKLGGIDKARRAFLKWLGVGAATAGAAKSGLLGLLKGGGKKQVVESLTQVPIGSADGMPAWFKPLVNKVIREGDDVTKKLATKDREIVHRAQIDKDASVDVIQDLDTGNVRIEYDAADNLGYGPIQLDYKAGEVIEQGSKKGTKTKPEFSAVESEPRVANWDGDIEFDGENIVNVVDDLMTDTTKLETYATGKNPTIKKLLKSEQKQKYVNKLNDDQMEQLEYIENKQGHTGPDDLMEAEDVAYHKYKEEGLASGGRVPLDGGGISQLVRPGKLGYAGKDKKGGIWKWKQDSYTLDPEWDDMDADEWLHIIKLLRAGEFGAAEGGRVPMVFGGRTIGVLKNLLTKMKKSHGVGRGEKSLKPDMFAKSIMSDEDKLKLLQLETKYANSALESLKLDRQLFKQLETNKEMKDQGLDVLMKHFVDTQTPHMKNYKSLADMDQAIIELETLVKNKTLKEGRKLNATGGRVPFVKGKLVEGLMKLANKIAPGSTKIGQTSKTMSGKTELKQSIAGFQEREAAKKADPFSPDFDMRAEADLIAKTPFTSVELKRLFGNQIDDNIIREIAAMDSAKQLKAIEDVKLYLRNMKNLRQETTLREFDVTGKKGHATGGRVSLSAGGLAGMLGE